MSKYYPGTVKFSPLIQLFDHQQLLFDPQQPSMQQIGELLDRF
jgi:hypothetical protein